mgnify:CR=1 FL=1
MTKFEKGEEIKDEIPGLMDFYATSIVSGVLSTTGFPENVEQWDDFCSVVAEFSYIMAAAMYAEKHRKTTKH